MMGAVNNMLRKAAEGIAKGDFTYEAAFLHAGENFEDVKEDVIKRAAEWLSTHPAN